jgi:ABC-2 type transport system permease protein
MSTLAAALPVPKVSYTRIFALETWTEFLRLVRTPAFSVPVISFPVMFYILFGVLLSQKVTPQDARNQVATFIVFGVMAPGLFGLGVSLAIERERGLLLLKRALPMPPAIYLGAKLAMAVVFASVIALTLITLSASFGHVVMRPFQWLSLFGLALLGVLPFCAMGLLIGTLVKGQAAAAVTNVVYLPMAFLSGLWMPLSALPKALANFAPVWPAYHLAALARAGVAAAPSGSDVAGHAVVLFLTTIVLFSLAGWRLSKRP